MATISLFYMCYAKSVGFVGFLIDSCKYDDILHTIWITDTKLLHFRLSKLGQILRVDKTGFPRLGHISWCPVQDCLQVWLLITYIPLYYCLVIASVVIL